MKASNFHHGQTCVFPAYRFTLTFRNQHLKYSGMNAEELPVCPHLQREEREKGLNMLGATNVAHRFLGCQVLCFWKMYKQG